MKPNHYLKGMALNNLSIACWWHKNPMFGARYVYGVEYEEVRMNRDFRQTKELLMNAIGAVENIEDMPQSQAIALQNLLNQQTDSMLALSSKSSSPNQTSYSIKQQQSLQPIYNLIQYYIYNDPIQKPLIMAWMRILLKSAARFQMQEMVDEVTAKYYLLNGDVEGLKKLLHAIVPKYETIIQEKQSSTTTNPLTPKLHLLQIYKMSHLVNKLSPTPQFPNPESKLLNLQSQLTQKDPFIFKRQFLMSEQLSFMKNGQ